MKQLDLTKIAKRLGAVPVAFKGKVAQVGIPAGLAYEDGTSVAYVAAIQEFGAPDVKIPPRPFFRPAIKSHSKEWADAMGQFIPTVSAGAATADDALQAIGVVAAADIQAEIASVSSPSLSPVTVLLRKWRKDGRKITGRTVGEAAAAIEDGENPGDDDKPLNDTGLLLASIRNAVAAPGEEFKA